MIVWSGTSSSGEFNTGGRYDPGTDSWTPTTTANAPMPRSYHTGVWTGNEMIVWGGLSFNTGYFVNTGGMLLCPTLCAHGAERCIAQKSWQRR